MLKLVNCLLGAACLVILGSDVVAATREYEIHHEVSAAAADSVGLSEAVSIAESHVAGRAVDADLQSLFGRDTWGVDVVSGDRKTRVWVDAGDGIVDIMTPEQPSR